MKRAIGSMIGLLLLLDGVFFGLVRGDYARGAFGLILSHIVTTIAKEDEDRR